MVVVAKFGGSVLRSCEGFRRAVGIVKNLYSRYDGVVVVVSAVKGVTDSLLRFRELGIDGVVESVYKKYVDILDCLGLGEEWANAASELSRLANNLLRVLWATNVLGEVSPRTRDHIVSFGERFSAVLMAYLLRSMGVKSRWMDGGEAGIITDENFGEANPLHEVSEKLVRENIGPLLEEGVVPVVTGFVASTIDGVTTLLGRGGSDYTATLLARYLDASEVRLYTDVPGVLSGDPRRIPGARTIKLLSYSEATELARLGLRKFHPRTFEPLYDRDIPVRVLGLEDEAGTLVTRHGGPPPVKAVTVLEDLAMVVLRGPGMAGRIGVLARAAGMLASSGINIVAVSQPPSETSIVFIVDARDGGKAKSILQGLVEKGIAMTVEHREPVATVSIIGDSVSEPEILGRIYSIALEHRARTVVMGWPSPVVSAIVDQVDAWGLAHTLHEEVVQPWLTG